MASAGPPVHKGARSEDGFRTFPPRKRSCTRPWIYVLPPSSTPRLGIDAVVVPAPEDNLLAHQSVFFGNPPRCQVLRTDHGNHPVRPKAGESIFHARKGGFGGVPLFPKVAPHMVANFQLCSIFNRLVDAATVANHFPRRLERHCPESVAIERVPLDIPMDP